MIWTRLFLRFDRVAAFVHASIQQLIRHSHLMSIVRVSSSLSWVWTSVVGFILVSYFLYALINKRNIKYMTSLLPPGPKGLPILGNLLMLGEFPHRDLHCLSKQYGPIMYLRLGFVPTIVISSPQAAELFLKTYDLIFASRPFNEAAKYISYDRKGLSFAEYGPYWRSVRKLCTLELLSTLKIDSFRSMRLEEVGVFIESLKEASSVRCEVDLSAKVLALSTDMSCLMVFGKKYIQSGGQGGFHTAVQEGMQLAAVFNIADYIPYIGALDIQGLAKRMKAVSKVFDDMFEKIIDEHVGAGDASHHQPDFVDVMLSIMASKDNEFKIDRSNIKSIILDMLVGSMDTSSTAIEWVLAELLKHPHVMKKVQQELEREVGLERIVEESDLVKLQYLDMVLKESFRLHPVAPLLIPHESMEDCRVGGYHIPRKSRIIVNTWAIGRDPKVWVEADRFMPERFMESSIDFKGRDFQFLPFGAGRRGCPGMQLGLTVIRLVVAQLVHCFDWELSKGMLCEELNMDEEFGLTMPRAKHLSLIPTYRLSL